MISVSFKRVGIVILFGVVFLGFFSTANSSAATKSIDCTDSIYNMFFVEMKKPVSGKVYSKLAKTIPDSPLNLYYQDPSGNSRCVIIGQTNANSDTWQQSGSIDSALQLKQILADGPTKSVDVYQATIKLLVLPEDNLCESVDTECHTTYQGNKGVLKPILQSGAIDQIAIYGVLPINDAKIKEVAYFSDGQFLYFDEQKQIKPVNKNYLADGKHTVTTQVTFDNAQKFTITKEIDMGKDYTGFTTLKSYYYKSKNRYLYVIGAIVLFILISVALMVARALHNRKLYKEEHGIENYKATQVKKEDEKDKIIVG